MCGNAETATDADEPSDNDEASRQAAWAEYFAAHPEVLASWAHQNGYWPPSATLTGREVWDA